MQKSYMILWVKHIDPILNQDLDHVLIILACCDMRHFISKLKFEVTNASDPWIAFAFILFFTYSIL